MRPAEWDCLADNGLMARPFQLHAPYEPKGDQPEAIKGLVAGVEGGERFQTLLGPPAPARRSPSPM